MCVTHEKQQQQQITTTTSGPVSLSFTKSVIANRKTTWRASQFTLQVHYKKLRYDRIRRRTALGTKLLVIIRQVLQPSKVNTRRRSWDVFDAYQGPQSTLRPAPNCGQWMQVSSKFVVVAA